MTPAEAWIALLLERGPELRKAGILSIGVDGCSAVLAPAEPELDADDSAGEDLGDEPTNPWEDGASYPTGRAPSLDRDDGELPPIPQFGDG